MEISPTYQLSAVGNKGELIREVTLLTAIHSLSAQHDLFCRSRHSAHCLNHLYTAILKPPGAMRLTARCHDFELPTVKFEFNKRNFIVGSLFQYV